MSAESLQLAFKDYKWYNSLSLPLELQCGIRRLILPDKTASSRVEALYVTAKLICNQTNMACAPVSTRFSSKTDGTIVWDSVISFPIKLRDLSLDSVIAFTAWYGQII